jgi:ABC-type proline/glycine betaine transport system permease subunit
VRGDFGQSFQFRAPAGAVVDERIWSTLHLALTTFSLTVLFGVPAGILAAARHRSLFDYGGIFLAALGQSLPNFWLGIMLILLFGVTFGWLPTSGYQGTAYPMALVARLTRSSMLQGFGTRDGCRDEHRERHNRAAHACAWPAPESHDRHRRRAATAAGPLRGIGAGARAREPDAGRLLDAGTPAGDPRHGVRIRAGKRQPGP